MTTWWVILAVAVIGVLAVKLDVGVLLDRRDRRKAARFQAECHHCDTSGDSDRLVVDLLISSPPGTIQAQCQRCYKVFGCLRDGVEEAERRWKRIAAKSGIDLAGWKME